MDILTDIAKEFFGPIADLAESVNLHFAYRRTRISCLAEVHLDVRWRREGGLRFGNAPLQASQNMLAMAFDNQLQSALLGGIKQEIGQRALRIGVQVQFRLLQQYD